MYLLHPGAGLHGHEYSQEPGTMSTPRSSSPRIQISRSSYSDMHISTIGHSAKDASSYPVRRPSPSRRRTIGGRVSFLDPATDTMSENGGVSGESDHGGSNVGSNGGKRRRRSTKHTSTSYYLAHPAPTLTQKQRLLSIRPKVLLQLQRLSKDSRPVPTLDVMSSTTFVPRITVKFPQLFKGKGELGINDVMVVRSDDYSGMDDEHPIHRTDESDREILSVICQAPKDAPWTAELCFLDGSRWNASPTSKGILELTTTDAVTGHRLVARWVPKGPSRRNSIQTPSRSAAESSIETRYQFSILDPNSRRHPVLATLDHGTLKIHNTYSSVSTPQDGFNVSSARTSIDEEHSDVDEVMEQQTHVLTSNQRLLIEVSAIWVALRQGWCPNFRYETGTPSCSPKLPSPPSSKSERPRSFSLTPNSIRRHGRNRSDTVTSIPESVEDATIDGTLRSTRSMSRACLSSATFLPHETERPGPKRSVSTGAAFMEKAAARRAVKPLSIGASGSESGSRPTSRNGSRPVSRPSSRPNSRPVSPRRAASMDLLVTACSAYPSPASPTRSTNLRCAQSNLDPPIDHRQLNGLSQNDGALDMSSPAITPNTLTSEAGTRRSKGTRATKRWSMLPTNDTSKGVPFKDRRKAEGGLRNYFSRIFGRGRGKRKT